MHASQREALHRGLWRAALALAIAMSLPIPDAMAQAADSSISYDLPAADLDSALQRFAEQSGLQVLYRRELVRGKRAGALHGDMSARAALDRLLAGSGLEWGFANGTTVVIKEARKEAGAAAPLAPANGGSKGPAGDDRVVGMPAIMVQGARTLNMDITRTRDDPQPYVVFDRELIERSGATTVEHFLQQRLPMNTSIASVGNAMDSDVRVTSNINLRGLGAAQTLILIDGHRMSSPMNSGGHSQGDITGIPLAAIERIEVLPSTASGIYGGSATGGVINIITRRDYSGGEVRLTYDNTFSTDSAIHKMDVLFGHNFNQGRTNLLLGASYSEANELKEADRNFAGPGRDRILRNNPDFVLGPWNMPLSSTPNIYSFDGSDLMLKSGVALGSPYTWVPSGYAGVATDGGAALARNAGTYNFELSSGPLGLRQTLYAEPTLKSGTLVLRHHFSDGLEGFVDLSSSESRRRYLAGGWGLVFNLPADLPTNPFANEVQFNVAIPNDVHQDSLTRHDRAVIGLVKQLAGGWSSSLDYTWDRTRVDFSGGAILSGVIGNDPLLNAVNAGEVDLLRDLEAFPLDTAPYLLSRAAGRIQSTMKDANLRVSGPLGSLPGGRPVFSAALAQRDESIPDTLRSNYPEFHWFYPARSTSVSSAYLEYRVPLFSEGNARPGLRELELQLAARYEDYVSRSAETLQFVGSVPSPIPAPVRVRNEFSSVDPTIALRWKPFNDLALRMSYGTGYIPPSLGQLVPLVPPVLYSATSDPRRGNTVPSGFTISASGNPDLGPESSRSWSMGLIFTPAALDGLRLSVDYTRIEKTDNIGDIPGFIQGVIDNEALFPNRVVRGPKLASDPPDWAGPIVHVDWTPMNLAKAELEAWDIQLDYRMDTQARGAFDLFLVGTWQPKYEIQLMSGQPTVDYVGVGSFNPLEFKMNGGLTWNLSAWRVGWNVSHFGSYRTGDNAIEIANQGNGGKVASQTYHDVFVNYDLGLTSGSVPAWLTGTQIQLGIRNLFDRKPPFDAGNTASNTPSYYSQFGSPRMASYYLTVTTRFGAR